MLDDEFVRAARYTEPTAADRLRRQLKVTGPTRSARRFLRGRSRPRRRAGRLITMLSLLMAFVALGVMIYRQATRSAPPPVVGVSQVHVRVVNAVNASGAPVPVLPVPADRIIPTAAGDGGVPVSSVGQCVRRTGDDAHALDAVSCADPETDTVTAIIDLSVPFPRWPGQADLVLFARSTCSDAMVRHESRFADAERARLAGLAAQAILPTSGAWDYGARGLVCTVRYPAGAERVPAGPVLDAPVPTVARPATPVTAPT